MIGQLLSCDSALHSAIKSTFKKIQNLYTLHKNRVSLQNPGFGMCYLMTSHYRNQYLNVTNHILSYDNLKNNLIIIFLK